MNVIGIIAEYNPFHNGHAYQIAHVRKNLHADYIVVATSGDYVPVSYTHLQSVSTSFSLVPYSFIIAFHNAPVKEQKAQHKVFSYKGKTAASPRLFFPKESF